MLAIRLPRDIDERLELIARRTGRTKTFHARKAILAHLEDPYLAEQRYEDVLSGKSTPIPLSDILDEHGLGR